jgi:CubicO group peptidase (beta-lactamase class C family)
VTKTVVATLVAIALDERTLRSVDQPLAELLPSYAHLMARDVKAITLHQLLTTTAGLRPDWPGQPPHFVTARDWVAAILADAETVYDPAPGFTQAHAESHLLSAILVAATGRPVLDYAREKLFEPLGIDTYPAAEPAGWPGHIAAPEGFAWPTDPQGHHVGFAGLTLSARDMAKLGRLWLDEGRWEGRQLVSAAWVEEATQQHVSIGGESGFGYQWWVTTADGHPAYAALGSGGQLLEVVPALGLVVVVSSTQAVGNAEADSYLELVATHIAPAVAR